jgi:hypothetical protein
MVSVTSVYFSSVVGSNHNKSTLIEQTHQHSATQGADFMGIAHLDLDFFWLALWTEYIGAPSPSLAGGKWTWRRRRLRLDNAMARSADRRHKLCDLGIANTTGLLHLGLSPTFRRDVMERNDPDWVLLCVEDRQPMDLLLSHQLFSGR